MQEKQPNKVIIQVVCSVNQPLKSKRRLGLGDPSKSCECRILDVTEVIKSPSGWGPPSGCLVYVSCPVGFKWDLPNLTCVIINNPVVRSQILYRGLNLSCLQMITIFIILKNTTCTLLRGPMRTGIGTPRLDQNQVSHVEGGNDRHLLTVWYDLFIMKRQSEN